MILNLLIRQNLGCLLCMLRLIRGHVRYPLLILSSHSNILACRSPDSEQASIYSRNCFIRKIFIPYECFAFYRHHHRNNEMQRRNMRWDA